jgi:hypothetical protein
MIGKSVLLLLTVFLLKAKRRPRHWVLGNSSSPRFVRKGYKTGISPG